MELLLGCGQDRQKRVGMQTRAEWTNLVTLDMTPEVGPDVVHDLENLPLPFPDNSADEIHAYEVLEHTGRQGDWRFFFNQFSDFWRILKPDGLFCASVPKERGQWAFGDPGHTRVFSLNLLTYLDQREYVRQKKLGTCMTDYRPYYKGDFHLQMVNDFGNPDVVYFVLKAIKPSSITDAD